MTKFALTILITFLFCNLFVHAQSRKDLENTKQSIKNEIEITDRLLAENKNKSNMNLTQLSVITRKIELQQDLVAATNKDLEVVGYSLGKAKLETERLNEVISKLKVSFSKSLNQSYKNRRKFTFLNFILSASSFNDAIKRIQYVKQYQKFIARQGEDILRVKQVLKQRIDELNGVKVEKEKVAQIQSSEMLALQNQEAEKNQILSELNAQGSALRIQLENKRRQLNEVTLAINRAIAKAKEEARKRAIAEQKERERLAKIERQKKAQELAALKKAQKEEQARIAAEAAKAPTIKPISNNKAAPIARNNKGRLSNKNIATESNTPDVDAPILPTAPKNEPIASNKTRTTPKEISGNNRVPTTNAPSIVTNSEDENPEVIEKAPTVFSDSRSVNVTKSFVQQKGNLPWPVDGYLLRRFGKQNLGESGVLVNPGYTIAAPVGTPVRCISDGEITSISPLDDRLIIIVQSGKYFVIYSNVTGSQVQLGQKVTQGQVLAKVSSNDDGAGEMDLMIVDELGREQNPAFWLRKK